MERGSVVVRGDELPDGIQILGTSHRSNKVLSKGPAVQGRHSGKLLTLTTQVENVMTIMERTSLPDGLGLLPTAWNIVSGEPSNGKCASLSRHKCMS